MCPPQQQIEEIGLDVTTSSTIVPDPSQTVTSTVMTRKPTNVQRTMVNSFENGSLNETSFSSSRPVVPISNDCSGPKIFYLEDDDDDEEEDEEKGNEEDDYELTLKNDSSSSTENIYNGMARKLYKFVLDRLFLCRRLGMNL